MRSVCLSIVFMLGLAASARLLPGGAIAAGPEPAAATPTALFETCKLTLAAGKRAELATSIGTYVRNHLDMSKPPGVEQAKKFLSVALALDPKDKVAYVANTLLSQSRIPGKVADSDIDAAGLTTQLLDTATDAKASKIEADRRLAAYLYSLVLEIKPDHEDAIFELGMLKDAGIKPEWPTTSASRPEVVSSTTTDSTPDVAPIAQRKDLILALSFDAESRFEKDGVSYARDSSGKNHHAVIHGASVVKGQFGQAVLFEANDQYLEVSHAAELIPARNLTVGAWVKPSRSPDFGTIVDKADWKGAGVTHGYVLRVSNGEANFAIGAQSKWYQVQAGPVLPADKWSHVVGTYDGIDLKLYVNGALTASRRASVSIDPSTHPLRIGTATYFEEARDRGFAGAIDEVIIMSRALSDSEVASMFKDTRDHGASGFAVAGSVTAKPINLMPLINVRRDSIQGTWKMTSDGLLSDGTRNARIRIQYRLPEEYDFRIVFTRTAGTDSVYQVMATARSSFVWSMGIWANSMTAFQLLDGKDATQNATAFRSQNVLHTGQQQTSVVQVRKRSVAAYLDGKLIGEFKGDLSRLTIHPDNAVGPRALGLGSWESSTLFRTIQLIPVTGQVPPGELEPEFTQEPNDPNTIERPEYKTTPKPIVKDQSSVKSMMVRLMDDGQMVGSASDIIATVSPDSRAGKIGPVGRGEIRFVGQAGGEMIASLGETTRAIRIRYPQWDGGPIDLSFEAHYDNHDGGSAGAALGMLMLSMLEGFDIDPSVAVTGDLTVDWKVHRVGGIAAKVRGAQLDKCGYALIPADNADAVDDMALLYDQSLLWDVQIFSIETLQEGMHIARTDRDSKIARAMQLFIDLRAKRTRASMPASFRVEERKVLSDILKLAPNHLSAKHLLATADGKAPRTLSVNASLYQFFMIAYPYRNALFGTNPRELLTLPATAAPNARKRASQLRPIMDRQLAPLLKDFLDLVTVTEKLATGRANGAELDKPRHAVLSRLEELQANRETMEKLIREGL